jgi:hypothetical protein
VQRDLLELFTDFSFGPVTLTPSHLRYLIGWAPTLWLPAFCIVLSVTNRQTGSERCPDVVCSWRFFWFFCLHLNHGSLPGAAGDLYQVLIGVSLDFSN